MNCALALGLRWAPTGRRKPDPLSSDRCHTTLGVQARPKFVCGSSVFMHTCPHWDRGVFQSNLTMAVDLSPQRLDNTDSQQHKVSEIIDRTGRHFPMEGGGWMKILRMGSPWARNRAHQLESKLTGHLGHHERLHFLSPHPLCSIHMCSMAFRNASPDPAAGSCIPGHCTDMRFSCCSISFKIQCMQFRRPLNWC